ncbi:MAG: transcriptional regulator [Devosia sp.]
MSEILSSPMNSPISNDCEEISLWKPEHGSRGTLVMRVSTLEQSLDNFERVWETGIAEPHALLTFVSYELMHKILAPNRMEIIRAMLSAGPLSIREIARRVGRDFKGVHTDVSSMRSSGLLYHTEDGKVVFPYDNIHVEYDISAAA